MGKKQQLRNVGALLVAGLCSLGLVSCGQSAANRSAPTTGKPSTSSNYPPLSIWDVASGINPPFEQNFNACAPYSSWPAGMVNQTVYEPLVLTQSLTYKTQPWLATSWAWTNGDKTLTFRIRKGVKWSDGKPFTAKDVYFTMTAAGKAGCDPLGLWTKGGVNQVSSVTMPTSDEVALHFRHVNTTFIDYVGSETGGISILPEHIFASHLKHIDSWIERNPVGTGPYTQLKRFTSQEFVLGQNPHYWKGKLAAPALDIYGYTSTSTGDLALAKGTIDWAGQEIPDAQRVYASKSPAYHFWYPYGFMTDPIFFNDTRYPYSLPAFRKALSMAVNRHLMGIQRAQGNPPPTNKPDPAGLDAWPTWIDHAIPDTYIRYNLAGARQLLRKAGFSWKGKQLIDPRGKPVRITLVPSLPSQEGESVLTIQSGWRSLGADVTIQNQAFSTMLSDAQRGEFQAIYGWMNGGPTPYAYFDEMFDKRYLFPTGKAVTSGWNWERWTNPEMNKLLAEFRATTDVSLQHRLVDQMQKVFYHYMPVIPTVMETIPADYNTTNYTGYPTPKDPYASGMAAGYWPDTLLTLTKLRRTH